MKRPRVGVFVCHCGINIAGVVKVSELVERAKKMPGVVVALDYQYCCSDPGQNLIRETILKQNLNRVVVACCSPTLHEKTFRKACAAAGLNPYLCEIANIREHCSWVTKDRDQATDKAEGIVAMTVARALWDESLVPVGVPVTRRALVVGAGIAGIQAALDIANAGYEVVLVERQPRIGGHISALTRTFPYLERAESVFAPKLAECASHPHIRLLTSAEVAEVSGNVGDFRVKIQRRAQTETEQEIEETVGAIVFATGYELFDIAKLAPYGAGQVADLVDSLEFERLLAVAMTTGELRRPSDGGVPKRVVFVQCAGSRDQEHGVPYCSKVCCMYTAKNALAYRELVPDGEAIVCYIDVRTPGKGFEEFYQRVTDAGVKYYRGKVARVFRNGDKVKVLTADTLAAAKLELDADLVVLATAMVADPYGVELARKLKVQVGASGFLSEAHPKLRPVETLAGGFFLAGTCQGPKDVFETVVQASAAAAKVLALFSQDKLYHEPTIAQVDEAVCVGCGYCEKTCAYSAVKVDERRRIAVVNPALCEGCGACAVACPSGAMTHRNFSKRSIVEMAEQV
ncbi:MAG: CoB--CoM heterodisulfide reductase iron-sulfur subunit A family protein [candidate division WOR-3 bacterium]